MIEFIPNKEFLREFVMNGHPSVEEINGRKIDDFINIGMINYQDKVAIKEAQKDFQDYFSSIDKIYEDLLNAFEEIANVLGEYPVKVFLTLLNNDHHFVIDNLYGILAHTLHDNTIVLYISSKCIKDEQFYWNLKVNLTHEYVHVIRNSKNIKNQYLIDYCTDEGLAEYLVYKRYGLLSIRPWASITENSINKLEEQIFLKAYSTDKNLIFKYLQGDFASNIQRWAGYKVGFHMINVLVNRGLQFDKLLYLSGKEVLHLYKKGLYL